MVLMLRFNSVDWILFKKPESIIPCRILRVSLNFEKVRSPRVNPPRTRRRRYQFSVVFFRAVGEPPMHEDNWQRWLRVRFVVAGLIRHPAPVLVAQRQRLDPFRGSF